MLDTFRGCVIGEKGPAVIPKNEYSASFVIGLLNSRFMNLLVHLQANFQQYDTGIIDRLPAASFTTEDIEQIEGITNKAIRVAREAASFDETEPIFVGLPRAETFEQLCIAFKTVSDEHSSTNKLALTDISSIVDKAFSVDSVHLQQVISQEIPEDDDETDNEQEEDDDSVESLSCNNNVAHAVMSFCIGLAFGRWDVRLWKDPSLVSIPTDPFAPILPIAPATLLSPTGFPAESGQIVSTEYIQRRANTLVQDVTLTISDNEYPIIIQWNGILVDDATKGGAPANNDLVSRIRQVFDVLWADNADHVERQVCHALGVKDLPDYFRKSVGFFHNHLKQYTKSRRVAPIYWPLSTSSGSYTLWLYYNRLTDQSLYTCVIDFIDPRLKELSDEIAALREKSSGSKMSGEIEQLHQTSLELEAFKEELLRLARLPWKPMLNDGVPLTAAPLWRVIGHKPWQKKLQQTYKLLEKGEFDWSHTALALWEKRVVTKCQADRSIAIAHNLQALFDQDDPKISIPMLKKGR